LPLPPDVKTLDTNVVVRLLIGDDPQQTPIAERVFLDAIAAVGVYLPDVVIDALEHFQRAGDLADDLILGRASRAGALPVLSFDRRFSARRGVQWLGTTTWTEPHSSEGC